MVLDNPINVPIKPTSKMGQSVDLIRRDMQENNYGLHDGCVYVKLEECQYTYIYCTTVKTYLLKLLRKFEIADVITPYVSTLSGLLSEPACLLIEPIKIDYNYIEVQDGYCFDIENKKFVRHPKKLKGSPRAYERYSYDENTIPNPEPFIEGMKTISTFRFFHSLLIIIWHSIYNYFQIIFFLCMNF